MHYTAEAPHCWLIFLTSLRHSAISISPLSAFSPHAMKAYKHGTDHTSDCGYPSPESHNLVRNATIRGLETLSTPPGPASKGFWHGSAISMALLAWSGLLKESTCVTQIACMAIDLKYLEGVFTATLTHHNTERALICTFCVCTRCGCFSCCHCKDVCSLLCRVLGWLVSHVGTPVVRCWFVRCD